MIVVTESFCEDAKNFVLDLLPSHRNELQKESWKNALLVHDNWVSRLIFPKPRRVIYSKELQQSSLLTKFQTEVENIQKKFEDGEDLKPYLSKRVDRFSTVSNPTSSTPDKDGLLNNWIIHHLHLRPVGSKELLFVKVFSDVVYFIDILDHKSFSNIDLLRIVKKNWPHTIEEFRMPLLEGQAKSVWSGEEINGLRKIGYSPLTIVDDSVYAFGITMSGHSLDSMGRIRNFHQLLLNINNKLEEKKLDFRDAIFSRTGLNLDMLKMKLVFDNSPQIYPFRIIEETSSVVFYQYPIKG